MVVFFSMAPASNAARGFQDTGQGASGRIAGWAAWTADPNPLQGPEQTRILREDDNGAGSGGPAVPLGAGGLCGGGGGGGGGGTTTGGSSGAGGDGCVFVWQW